MVFVASVCPASLHAMESPEEGKKSLPRHGKYPPRHKININELDIVSDIALKAVAGVPVPTMTPYGSTFDLAARYHRRDVIERLVAAGIVPTSRTLHCALMSHDQDLVTSLLKRFPELMKSDGVVGTPLHGACLYDRPDFIHYFLEHGIDVNGTNDRHETALHMAVSKGHENVVALLCQHGANPLLKNARGFDALDIAYRRLMGPKKEANFYDAAGKAEQFSRILGILYKHMEKFGGSKLSPITFPSPVGYQL